MKKTDLKHQVPTHDSLANALVVGGASFIGSFLCQLLIEQNSRVFCLDNLETGKKENIEPLSTYRNFHFIEHDLIESLDRLKLPKLDYIFHLASIESYLAKGSSYLKDLNSLKTNSLGTANLLELAKSHQAKFLLGSTPHVFEVVISTQEISSYFGSKKDNQALFALAEGKRFSESLVFEYFKNYDLDCRIVRMLDVYGPRMPLDTDNEIASLFKNLKMNKRLYVAGDGSQIIYPTFITDLSTGLLKAMFSQASTGKIYTLANPTGIGLLSLAHQIVKLSNYNQQVEFIALKYQEAPVEKKDLQESKKDLHWQPKVELDEGIKKTLDWLKIATVAEGNKKDKDSKGIKHKILDYKKAEEKQFKQTQPLKFDPSPILRKPRLILNKLKSPLSLLKKFKIIFILFLSFLLILSFPLINFFYYFKKGISSFESQDYSNTIIYLDKSKEVLINFDWLTSLFFLKDKTNNIISVLESAMVLLEAEENIKKAETSFNQLMKIIIQDHKGDSKEEVKKIKLYLDKVFYQLGVIESEIKKSESETETNLLINSFEDKLETVRDKAPDLRIKIDQAREALNLVPLIFSFETRKTYLVLLENNLELRPGGGFITSYGLLSFEKGKLLDFQIEDVYTADNQLKGRVLPPKPIEKYLGEKNWYLRDSNWQPDFTDAAEQAEWFIENEIGRSVDGTIALTLDLLKKALEVLGPVKIEAYNETVTTDNLLERVMYYSEIDLGANSNKKSFLNQLFSLIFEKAQNVQGDDWLKLVSIFEKSLNEKQLVVYDHNKNIKNFMIKNNWNGAIRQPLDNKKSSILADYLMLVEANLGINKVNYFLKRQLIHEVTILDKGELIESLTIFYDNSQSSKGWPGGDYKNYLRLYVPANSQLVSVKIGRTENDLEILAENRIDQQTEYNKTVYGFLVEVPAQDQIIVKVSYRPKSKLQLKGNLAAYLFLWQKQLGISTDQLTLVVNYPSSLKPIKIAPEAKIRNNQIIFLTQTNKDKAFLIDFKK